MVMAPHCRHGKPERGLSCQRCKNESANRRGQSDYTNGIVVGDNPYEETDIRHWHWMDGWAAAGLAKANNPRKPNRFNIFKRRSK